MSEEELRKKWDISGKTYFELVKDFHDRFGHPAPDYIVELKKEERLFRSNLISEEVLELAAQDDIVGQIDALVDVMYFVFGTFVQMGIDPRPFFEIVHEANMAKLYPDGKPRYQPNGKVQKPPDWEPPERRIYEKLKEIWDEQYTEDRPF